MNFDLSSGIPGWAWPALALVNAGLAEAKGRSRLRWFLISLFVGPVATALIVIWPRETAPRPEPLHPISSVTDRFLFFATFAMVIAIVAALLSIAAGVSGADLWIVATGILLAVGAAGAYLVLIRGYRRRSLRS